MFEVNGKQISHKDLNIVRDFFTDEQWDLIDYALSEAHTAYGIIGVKVWICK